MSEPYRSPVRAHNPILVTSWGAGIDLREILCVSVSHNFVSKKMDVFVHFKNKDNISWENVEGRRVEILNAWIAFNEH